MAVRKKIDWKTVAVSVIVTIVAVGLITGIGLKGLWAATRANLKM